MYEDILTRLKELKFINENNKVSPWIERKITDSLREEIIQITSFIIVDVTLSDRIRTMLLGITEQPFCYCGNPTNFHRELKNYAKFCCNLCYNKSEEKAENLSSLAKNGKLAIGVNTKKHQHEKYNGVMAIQADKSIIEKVKQTCLERYGVDNGSKTEDARRKISRSAKKKRKQYKEKNPFHFNNRNDENFDYKKEYDAYTRKVRHLTERNYKKYKNNINPLDLPRTKTEFHLDHIISIKKGFDSGIPPEEIADVSNLQMLTCEENRNKWHK